MQLGAGWESLSPTGTIPLLGAVALLGVFTATGKRKRTDMIVLYIIAGVILWITIGAITFRLMDWWFGDDPTWHHPRSYEMGRVAHAKMGFWLGPVYTLTMVLILILAYATDFFKWLNEGAFYRKLMGLDNG